MPSSSRRATRSVTEGLDISNRLASSDIVMRGFACKIDSNFRSVSSNRPLRFKSTPCDCLNY